MLKKSLFIVDVLLLIAGVYFGISVYDTLASRDSGQPVQSTESTVPGLEKQMQKAKPLASYRGVSERNLFGVQTQEKVKQPDVKPMENLEPTRLKLKLWGTANVYSDAPYAVIEDSSSRRQLLYREGDAVEGARVKTILKNRVVLQVEGRNEVLEMESLSSGVSTMSRTQMSQATPPPSSVGRMQSSTTTGSISRQARVRPYFEKGKRAGLIVTGIRSGSVFEKIGLRNSDILVNVNGQPVVSSNDYRQFLQSVESSSDLKLQVRRRGQIEEIEYSFR